MLDEALGGECAQSGRLSDEPPETGGGYEPEQVGDGARADDGRPEPTDGGVGRVVPVAAVDSEEGLDPRPGDGSGAGDRCGARDWRDSRLDGRTNISTDEPGRCNGHARLISNERV